MRPSAVTWLTCLTLPLVTGCHSVFLRPTFVAEARLETPSFLVRTDLGAESRKILVAAAEEMRWELEAVYPRARAAGSEPRREIVAFSVAGDFRKFLGSHLFAQERAIGFYCDLGGECALAWRDPPGPEDVRVLRHELVHQHLAARLHGRIPAWLEEGLAERHALGFDRGSGEEPADLHAATKALDAAANGLASDRSGWADYRARRLAADAIFAALEVQNGRRSWPEAAAARPDRLPPPTWAAGEAGYVLHLLFIRFLESLGEGRVGALGACLARASEGEEADLDLSMRFATVGALEHAFHAFVLREGLAALITEGCGAGPRAANVAVSKLGCYGRSFADGAAPDAPTPETIEARRPTGARLLMLPAVPGDRTDEAANALPPALRAPRGADDPSTAQTGGGANALHDGPRKGACALGAPP